MKDVDAHRNRSGCNVLSFFIFVGSQRIGWKHVGIDPRVKFCCCLVVQSHKVRSMRVGIDACVEFSWSRTEDLHVGIDPRVKFCI